jgi:hypothetical protein
MKYRVLLRISAAEAREVRVQQRGPERCEHRLPDGAGLAQPLAV